MIELTSRRRFVQSALATGAAGLLLPARAEILRPLEQGGLDLESASLALTLDRKTGCVDRLESKDGSWKLRGAGMRLHVPAPDRRFHFLTEKDTGAPRIDSEPNGATIRWTGFKSPLLGALDIEVEETIRLEGRAARFSYRIRNGSSYRVESYTYPRLAGMRPPSGDARLRQVAGGYSGMASSDLWPRFASEVGYWGSDYPAQLRHLGTDNQFCMVLGDARGLYLGYHDPEQKQVVQVSFQLQPGYADSYNSRAVDASGQVADPAVSVDVNHLCFIAPGASGQSREMVVEPFEGTWHAGVDVYKSWRRTWHTKRPSPAWVHDVHSWQQIQINSAEDRLAFDYKSLTRYAEACKRWGVRAIQLTGWQAGGQDRQFPVHDTDPRLGTAEELKDAIAECRKMGVEIILFNKYAWADVTAPAYLTEFKKFAIEDPYGAPYTFNGYAYDTPTQTAGIGTRHGAGMCMASPPWRERALVEFKKSVDLGASGILFDECQWHISPLCFSKSHGHTVPGAVFSGDVPLIDGFRTIVDPEKFLFAGESPYDVELQTYTMSYFRIGNGFTPFGRYIDPFAPMSVAVTGFDDRRMINACLLYRFSMSYEPRNFHGELNEFPATMTYGASIDSFRRTYREWVWDAEFRDKLGARVVVEGKPHEAYTVFQRTDGLRAVVAANMGDTQPIECEVQLDGSRPAKLVYVTPEFSGEREVTGRLKLDPGCAAAVIEKSA